MLARMTTALILVSAVIGTAYAGPIVLENTIPSGSLFTQPPVLTGAAPLFGGGGVVVADAFTAPVSAALSQISVVVDYEFFLPVGVIGTSPLLLTLLNDDGDSPGTPIESWIVPLLPSDTSLTTVTENSITNALLLAGDQYWVSVRNGHSGSGTGDARDGRGHVIAAADRRSARQKEETCVHSISCGSFVRSRRPLSGRTGTTGSPSRGCTLAIASAWS
jgi:hypothetical protein